MLKKLTLTVITLGLATAWLALVGLGSQTNKPSPEAKQYYAEARRLLTLGEKEKALEELKTVIRLAPDFVDAHRDLLDNQRDKAESLVGQYEAYVRENPNSAIYHYLLGKAYSNANKREKADAEYQKALELDPQFGWAMLAVSSYAARSGNRDLAIELLQKASKNAGDSISLRSAIANTFIGKKMFEEAIEEAERMLQMDQSCFEAYRIKWQGRLNLTFGADETRAEVLGEIQNLEANHSKDVAALSTVRDGYQMLENEEGAARAKKSILALDPKYYDRQPYTTTIGTSSGKTVKLTGPNARLFGETFSMKDDKQKLEAYKKLEKDLDDADARMYALYPFMLRSYVALKDLENAQRVVDIMARGNVDPRALAEHRVTLARACFESKTKLDTALDYVRSAIEQLRQPVPKKEGGNSQAAEFAAESARNDLARALYLEGQILSEMGMAQQAAKSLDESVKLHAEEDNLLETGLAYSRLSKKDEAIDALTKAYAFEGKRQQEARAALEKNFGLQAKGKPLAVLLSEAVDRHRAEVREAAMHKALREIAKTEPKEAPAFTLSTVTGQKVRLGDLRGKIVLLNFWATW